MNHKAKRKVMSCMYDIRRRLVAQYTPHKKGGRAHSSLSLSLPIVGASCGVSDGACLEDAPSHSRGAGYEDVCTAGKPRLPPGGVCREEMQGIDIRRQLRIIHP